MLLRRRITERARRESDRQCGEAGSRSLGSDIAICRRVVHELRRYWPYLIATLLVSLLSMPFVLLSPLPLKIAVDSVIGTKPVPAFFSWALPRSVLASG